MVASTGSTNADLLARGGPEGQVLVAEEQTAGRGRAGRTWVSVPGASLTFSVLLRPASVPPSARGWLPLLTGVAVAAAVRSAAGVAAVLKWPNDVLVGDRKLAGILAEQSPTGDAVVVGVGLNVATPQDALPVSPAGLPATSLLVEGADVAREPLLVEILRSLEREYLAFRADPDPAALGPAGGVHRRLRNPGPHGPGRTPGWPRAHRRGRRHRWGRATPRPPRRSGLRYAGLGRRCRPPALDRTPAPFVSRAQVFYRGFTI